MAQHVEKVKNKALLKKYLGILRKNAKHELYSNVFTELMDKAKPEVEQARAELKEFGEMDQRKALGNVFRTLVKNFSNTLFSYFLKWRLEGLHHNEMMQRVKMLTIRSYKNQLASGFGLWKRKADRSRLMDITLALDMSTEEGLQK